MGLVVDQIADMLTRIRNAGKTSQKQVSMASSEMKRKIAEILKQEGYIENFEIKTEDKIKHTLEIHLKYVNNQHVIKGLKRISKPGLRVYSNSQDLPKVLNGLGIAIVSTTSGLMTADKARKTHLGGEVVAYV